MQQENKISLIGVIVVISLTLFVVAVIQPALHQVKMISMKTNCGTNLKTLGIAMLVYSDDYDDNFPQLPGTGPWSKNLGFEYDLQNPDFSPGGAQQQTPRTISASLYLLVREADLLPKYFVCPGSFQSNFDGYNTKSLELVELWDFGPDPYKYVSYSYHNPYGNFPARKGLSAAFAIVADMSPWFKDGDIVPPGSDNNAPQIIDFSDSKNFHLGNSTNHSARERFWPHNTIPNTAYEQNIVFADGHSMCDRSSDVGVRYDNIYTFWPTAENPTEQDIRNGKNPTSRSKENDAQSRDDSFLAI